MAKQWRRYGESAHIDFIRALYPDKPGVRHNRCHGGDAAKHLLVSNH